MTLGSNLKPWVRHVMWFNALCVALWLLLLIGFDRPGFLGPTVLNGSAFAILAIADRTVSPRK